MSTTGLDMYLKAELFVSGSEHSPADKPVYDGLVDRFGVGGYVEGVHFPHATVGFIVAYWRKANAIHSWFVREVQQDKDECLPHHVSRGHLRDLRNLCSDIVRKKRSGHHDVEEYARSKLAPQEGFYFGTYSVDEWYWESLEDTITQLDRALEMPPQYEFIYRSSW